MNKRIVGLAMALWGLLAGSATADTVIYYRDSDGSIVASTTSPNPVDADREVQSLGPGIRMLRLETEPRPQPGNRLKVQQGILTEVPDPAISARQARRDSARQKLQDLGFSPEETREILGD